MKKTGDNRRFSRADVFRPHTLVRVAGLEPVRSCPHKNLNLARLPIPPHPHI